MLPQGHMGAPLYRYTRQGGPRFEFGDSEGPLWSDYDVTSTSWLRLTISNLDHFKHQYYI